MYEINCSKIEIRQADGEKGIFSEILIDGHKLRGVRSFELKQGVGDSVPTLTVDLNAFDYAIDLKMLRFRQAGHQHNIESITFCDDDGEGLTKSQRTTYFVPEKLKEIDPTA